MGIKKTSYLCIGNQKQNDFKTELINISRIKKQNNMKTKFQEIFSIVENQENGKGRYIEDFRIKENKVAFRICDEITNIFCYIIVASL